THTHMTYRLESTIVTRVPSRHMRCTPIPRSLVYHQRADAAGHQPRLHHRARKYNYVHPATTEINGGSRDVAIGDLSNFQALGGLIAPEGELGDALHHRAIELSRHFAGCFGEVLHCGIGRACFYGDRQDPL